MKTVIENLLAEYDMSNSAFAKDLREALAEQPAQDQQPFCYHDGRNIVGKDFAEHSDVFPLYTAPQPAQQDWEAIAADQAMTIALLKAEQPAQQQEPFGYFKAEPFGWIDCADTDEGAIALYERPQPAQQEPLTDEQLQEIEAAVWGAAFLRPRSARQYARAIEAAHGIKENT